MNSYLTIVLLFCLQFPLFGQDCSRYSEEELHNTVEKIRSGGFEFINYLVIKPSDSVEKNHIAVFSKRTTYRFEVINFSKQVFEITLLANDSIIKKWKVGDKVKNEPMEFTSEKTGIYNIRLIHSQTGCVFTGVGFKRQR
ncbi:MAG: hypothetical protein ACI85I_000752 [Arenicella sp.]|jgi:hypothetical protein